jgi:hypothetical protein
MMEDSLQRKLGMKCNDKNRQKDDEKMRDERDLESHRQRPDHHQERSTAKNKKEDGITSR